MSQSAPHPDNAGPSGGPGKSGDNSNSNDNNSNSDMIVIIIVAAVTLSATSVLSALPGVFFNLFVY